MTRSYGNENTWSWRDEVLFDGRKDRVLNGRPALKSLRELEAALVWLPGKRLIAGAICDGEDVCAVGAFALRRRIDAGRDGVEEMDRLKWSNDPDGTMLYETADLAASEGMTWTLGWIIGETNDYSFESMTPEQRYEAVLGWTRTNIARLEAKFATNEGRGETK